MIAKNTYCGQPVYLNAQAAFEDYYNAIMVAGVNLELKLYIMKDSIY